MRRRTAMPFLLMFMTGAAHAVELGDAARGLAYARVNCAECHAVQAPWHVVPFEEVPTFRDIANTPGISELALISFFQTPHPTMPDFQVPASDVRDLTAYFATLRSD
jgi:mono/diheme cytochrome c family protein